MLTVYIIAAAIGGVLVLLSALGGGHDADGHELDSGEAHAEIDTGADHDHGGDHDHGEHGGDLGWLSFFGMRFWSYFSGFFGLTGVLLTYLTDLASPLVGAGAVLLGLVSGASVSTATRLLTKSQTSSAVGNRDLIGAEGTVLVTVRKESPGKIRISVRGDVIDLQAVTTDPNPLAVGREVIIVSSEDHRVTVVPKEALLLESKAQSSEPIGG